VGDKYPEGKAMEYFVRKEDWNRTKKYGRFLQSTDGSCLPFLASSPYLADIAKVTSKNRLQMTALTYVITYVIL